MKYIQLLIMIICTASGVYAQKEFSNKTIVIPPRFDTDIPAKPNVNPDPGLFTAPAIPPLEINAPTVFDLNPKKSNTIRIGEDQSNGPVINDFADPGAVYQRKINKVTDKGDYKAFRKNQYLGDFKSKANRVKVMYRDFGAVDGDKIRVYVNSKIIRSETTLLEYFQGFDLTLEPGFNKIDFEALNQGSSGPNTAEFRVYDDQGILISGNQWNLATGFKASIIIVKEVE